MFKVNDNFVKLPASYLFSQVAAKIAAFQKANPETEVIRMGIGDVTRPVCDAALKAMRKAVDDEGATATFHGYGPEQGYAFLRDKIAETDYHARGLNINSDEIFISDGAKSDTGNIGDLFALGTRIAVTDPVYPVYVDTNVMAGRAGELESDGRWSNIEYLPCTAQNGFIPALPTGNPDVIYLCYPNNPTGTTLTRDQLQVWVDYAIAHKALLLFDSAYEAYVRDSNVPRSIYEIEGAEKVAIEFRSFSKTAGFTGLRCGYTVIPKALMAPDCNGNLVSLHSLWLRRQSTKFNGASYVIQRGAEALYSPEGQAQVAETINYYMRNAALLLEGIRSAGLEAFGGENSPYVWIKVPAGMDSWGFFDRLLNELHIAGTPGVGFGPSGEGYFRLTAFNTLENTQRAVDRIKEWKL